MEGDLLKKLAVDCQKKENNRCKGKGEERTGETSWFEGERGPLLGKKPWP